MIHPLEDDGWIDKVGNRPLHHRLIANRNRLHDIWILVGKLNGGVDFCRVIHDVALAVIWSRSFDPSVRLGVPDTL